MAGLSWFNQIHREWQALKLYDTTLDIEQFYGDVISTYRSGFAPFESVATTANALLLSTIAGAPYLGRKLLVQVGIDKHPALGVAYALSLFAGTGGDSDPELANRILGDVLKDENAQDKLKGLSAAALGDSARLGRGEAPKVELEKARYETAFGFGHREAAQTLALYL
jgi:hypothetical protein